MEDDEEEYSSRDGEMATSAGKRRMVPHSGSRGGRGVSQGLKGGEIGRVMDEDPAALARRHGLLMAALQAAVISSQMLESGSVFSLSLISKDASEAVRQHVRAIGGKAKVRPSTA